MKVVRWARGLPRTRCAAPVYVRSTCGSGQVRGGGMFRVWSSSSGRNWPRSHSTTFDRVWSSGRRHFKEGM